MELSILLPTYNRCSYLIKNVKELVGIIKKNNLQDIVDIIISDNNSPDETEKTVLHEIQKAKDVHFTFKKQSSNIGLEANALFTLKISKSSYIMYLGDDDYITEKYLLEVLQYIQTDPSIGSILPSYENHDINGKSLGKGRDLDIKTESYPAGFKNCYINSWRGHQLSGLVFKREGLFEDYQNKKINNIYPFVFFTARACLLYKTIHLTDYPVKVTQPGQANKDWGYGDDGLVAEFFDNYNKLSYINSFQKLRLKYRLLDVQKTRFIKYRTRGRKAFWKALFLIGYRSGGDILYMILYPSLISVLLFKYVFHKHLYPAIRDPIKALLRRRK